MRSQRTDPWRHSATFATENISSANVARRKKTTLCDNRFVVKKYLQLQLYTSKKLIKTKKLLSLIRTGMPAIARYHILQFGGHFCWNYDINGQRHRSHAQPSRNIRDSEIDFFVLVAPIVNPTTTLYFTLPDRIIEFCVVAGLPFRRIPTRSPLRAEIGLRSYASLCLCVWVCTCILSVWNFRLSSAPAPVSQITSLRYHYHSAICIRFFSRNRCRWCSGRW